MGEWETAVAFGAKRNIHLALEVSLWLMGL